MTSWDMVSGTPWTLGELKSAFQKFVRRHDPRAITVANVLLAADREARTALLRRLPIVAAEEGTLAAVPAAVDVAVAADGAPEIVTELGCIIVRAMLGTARDKDPVYLMEFVQLHGPEGLDGVEQEAWEVTSSWSMPRARAMLGDCEQTVRNPLVREIIVALRQRAAAGMGGGDWPWFVGLALALRARERAGVEPIVLPIGIAESAPMGAIDVLPWWSLDPHVAIGQTVLREVLTRWPGMSFERGFAIWFHLVSDVVEGYVPREGWRGKHAALCVSDAEREWWSQVEPFVRRRLEELIASRIVRVPPSADRPPAIRSASDSATALTTTASADSLCDRMSKLRAMLHEAGN